jgi:ABC-type bacteriocin/lantibiotic exporter with double-glycine peptidase domain
MTVTLQRDEAAQLTAWAVETLATAVGFEADPVSTRQLARESLAGRTEVSEELLTQSLMSTAASARLHLQPLILDPSTFCDVPLPVMTPGGGGAAVTQRRGDEVLVERPNQAPSWMKADALFALLGDVPHPWLTATPAAPLTSLSHEHNHGLKRGHHAGDDHHVSPARRAWELMRLERDDLWVVFIFAAAVGLLSLATPIAVQALVGTVAFGTLLQPIVVLSLMLVAALGFQKTIEALQLRVVESLEQRIFVRVATDLAWRLPRVKREAADEGFGPETVNRFFDTFNVQKTANILLTTGIATALQITIGMVVLAFYHPALLAFDLVLGLLLIAVVVLPFSRGLKTSIDESYAKYDVAAWLEELARTGSALRGASGVGFAAERADALAGRYLEARRKHFRIIYGQTIASFGVQIFASAAVLGLGGWLVVNQSLTLGQLVAAELIVAAVANSIVKMGKLLEATYDLLTAVDKLGHIIDLPIESPEQGEAIPGTGPVRLEVHGAVDGDETPLSFEIPAGSRLAIVGAEGHPLGEWLAGLRVPPRGAVSFNGVESSRGCAPTLREHIAAVHRGDFFEGTVLENLTLGRPGVTASDARAALEKVGLLASLRALPQGLDTRLAHNGAPLTQSQLTQLMVARALMGQPRLIVVDESLESIEPQARERCVAALTRKDAPWTLIALVGDAGAELAKGCVRVVTLAELARQGRKSEEAA